MANVNRHDLAELKSLPSPPVLVKDVMVATMLLLGYSYKESQDWRKAKKVLANPAELLHRLRNYDAGKITQEAVLRAKAHLVNAEPAFVRKVSSAAYNLSVWANAMVSEQT